MTMDKVYEFLSLIRYKNLLILIFTQLFLFFVLLNEQIEIELLAVVISTFFAAAGGNVINDYYDKKADEINKPYLKRSFTDKQIVEIYTSCVVVSLCCVLCLPPLAMCVIVTNNILLYVYSMWLKRLPLVGNFVVSYLASSAIFVFLFVYNESELEVIVFSVFTFFIHLIRELVKDIEDIEGDEVAGYKTLPIVVGVKRTKWLTVFVQLLFVLALMFLSIKITTSLLLYNCVVSVPFLVVILIKTIRAKSKKEYRRISNYCKLLMLFGVLGMLFC